MTAPTPLLTVAVRDEDGVVDARAHAKHLSALLGLAARDQVRVATVVSELARNALRYAGGGAVDFSVNEGSSPLCLIVRVRDRGPGIRDLARALTGGEPSAAGPGVGLAGSRRLMDTFEVRTPPEGGTVVEVGKFLPPDRTAADVRRAAHDVVRARPANRVDELQDQNQELLRALAVLAEREERLRSLNQELEDTNRGVVALYAELEEKAERLRAANELKTTFLSYMSHEFRTPLNSILGLTGFLLARLDGDLTDEQETQVRLVRGAAGDLLGMVNDLLDLTKVEAGKSDVHVTTFTVHALFATLRALFAPVATNPDVALVFEEPRGVPPLSTDEGKVSQVLRNFVSNALKFTPRGDVRVSATFDAASGEVRFAVRDTGPGIAPDDQAKLFRDFSQLHSPLVKVARGSGLGLSIARTFAELLGGRVGMISAVDRGSEFYAHVPATYPRARTGGTARDPTRAGATGPPARRFDVTVVDDNEADRYMLRALVHRLDVDVREAIDAASGLASVRAHPPDALLLDFNLPDASGLDVLRALRDDSAARDLPVLIVTAQTLDEATLDELRPLRATVHDKHRVYDDGDAFVAAVRRALDPLDDAGPT